MSYREILDDAIGHAPPTGVDIEAVVRRQRRAARVRPALATLAAAAVVATGGGVALQLTGGDAPVPVPGDQRDGIPEYHDGYRDIAGAFGAIAERQSFTFTPAMLDLALVMWCESDEAMDAPVVLSAEIETSTAESTTILDWFCIVGGSGPPQVNSLSLQDAEGWGRFWDGLAVGEAVTIEVEVVEARAIAGGGQPAIPGGTFQVSVAERVPFEEYEFPSPPATLEPISEAQPLAVEVRPDEADPNLPVEAAFEWTPELVSGCGVDVFPLELVSQTPGRMLVSVNGEPVADPTWWDYEQLGYTLPLAPECHDFVVGDEITIRVEPEQMTGDWRVRVRVGG